MHISENYTLKSSTKSNASTKISYKSCNNQLTFSLALTLTIEYGDPITRELFSHCFTQKYTVKDETLLAKTAHNENIYNTTVWRSHHYIIQEN